MKANRWVRCLGICGALSLVVLLSPAPAQAGRARATSTAEPVAVSDTRTVHDAATGSTVTISGEGNCQTAQVDVTMPGSATDQFGSELRYYIDSVCNVIVEPGRLLSKDDLRVLEGSNGQPGSVATESSSPGGVAPASVWYGNYIHSSSTLLDPPSIDIAKVLYHTDRRWNNASTEWKTDLWGEGDEGKKACNHYLGGAIEYIGAAAYVPESTTTEFRGDFHSDFLHCNFQRGQNFSMWNKNRSYGDGRYDAHFRQSQVCSLTHMATRKWVSTNRYG